MHVIYSQNVHRTILANRSAGGNIAIQSKPKATLLLHIRYRYTHNLPLAKPLTSRLLDGVFCLDIHYIHHILLAERMKQKFIGKAFDKPIDRYIKFQLWH